MRMKSFMILSLFVLYEFCSAASKIGEKSKICANDLCSDALFTSKVVRVHQYPDLLNVQEGETVEVLAIKFSDRPDIIEARSNGVSGMIFGSSLDPQDYVSFLKFAIGGKKEFVVVAQDSTKVGAKKVLAQIRADEHLIRDYNVKAVQLAQQLGEPAPELLKVPEPEAKGHGHSHGGHGHSHGGHGHLHDNHGHSHEEGHSHDHGHSHEAPAPATTPTPAVVEEKKTEEPPKEKPVAVVEPNNAAEATIPTEKKDEAATVDKKDTLTQEEIDAMVTQMMEEDLKKMAEDPTVLQAANEAPPPQDVGTTTAAPPVVEEPATVTPTPIPAEPVTEAPQPPSPVEVTPPPIEAPPLPILTEAPPPPEAPSLPIHDLPTTTPAPPPIVEETLQEAGTVDKGFCFGDSCPEPKRSIPPPDDSLPPLDPSASPSPPLPMDPFANDSLIPNESHGASLKSHWFAEMLRKLMPSLFSNQSDGAIGLWVNISFVIGAVLLVGVTKLFGDGGDSENYDRRAAHNLSTALKSCQTQLAAREAELAVAARGSVNQQYVEEQALQLQQLQRTMAQTTADLERVAREGEADRTRLATAREALGHAEERASKATGELQAREREVIELQQLVERARAANDHAESNANRDRQERTKAEEELKRTREGVRELEAQLEKAKEEEAAAKDGQRKFESQLAEAYILLAEKDKQQRKSATPKEEENAWENDWGETPEQDAAGSSANGSWSHGEEEHEDRDTTVTAGSVDMQDIIQLRARITQLQGELSNLRASLDREKDRLESEKERRVRVENEKADIEKGMENKMKEMRERMDEKERAMAKAELAQERLIEFMQGSESRGKELSMELNNAKSQCARHLSELETIKEEKKRKEDRLSDVEKELKRLNAEHYRLETKHFNDVRALKQKLTEQQSQLQSAPFDPLMNLSASSSLEGMSTIRASLDTSGGGSGGGLSLWDEPSDAEIMSANPTRRTPSSDLLGGGGMRRSVRAGRRSDRVLLPDSNSPLDSGSGGEMNRRQPVRVEPVGARRRSRSHGRQSAHGMPYFAPGPPMAAYDYPPPMYGLDPVARRHSRSGQQLYYSSGGSNGGRSPPPEMPLVAGMPPPGVRKPTSKRASGFPPS